jgi:hypothetical protein
MDLSTIEIFMPRKFSSHLSIRDDDSPPEIARSWGFKAEAGEDSHRKRMVSEISSAIMGLM